MLKKETLQQYRGEKEKIERVRNFKMAKKRKDKSTVENESARVV